MTGERAADTDVIDLDGDLMSSRIFATLLREDDVRPDALGTVADFIEAEGPFGV